MQSILSAAAIYVFLLVVFRIAGKRTLKDATVFDFVLLLIIGEATQGALIGADSSWTNAALVISTLIALDIGLSLLKRHSRALERTLDDVPLLLVDDGRPIRARTRYGLERLDQVKYAVLERGGRIAIVPRERDAKRP